MSALPQTPTLVKYEQVDLNNNNNNSSNQPQLQQPTQVASLVSNNQPNNPPATDINRTNAYQQQPALPQNGPKPRGRRKKIRTEPIRPICPQCEKQFSNQSALTKHKLTHSDERKFACQQCSKAFKRHDHLTGHMQTHSNRKPFNCTIMGCDKTYCDARSLRRHKENIHHIVTPKENGNNNNGNNTNLNGISNSSSINGTHDNNIIRSLNGDASGGVNHLQDSQNHNGITHHHHHQQHQQMHHHHNGSGHMQPLEQRQINGANSYLTPTSLHPLTPNPLSATPQTPTIQYDTSTMNTSDNNQQVLTPTTPTVISQFQPQQQQQAMSTTPTNTYQQPQALAAPLNQQTGSFNTFASAMEPSHLYRRRLQRLNSDSGSYNDDQPRLDTLMTCPIDHPSSQHNHHGYHNNHASFSADYASTQHFSFDFNHPMNHQRMSSNNHQTLGNMSAPHGDLHHIVTHKENGNNNNNNNNGNNLNGISNGNNNNGNLDNSIVSSLDGNEGVGTSNPQDSQNHNGINQHQHHHHQQLHHHNGSGQMQPFEQRQTNGSNRYLTPTTLHPLTPNPMSATPQTPTIQYETATMNANDNNSNNNHQVITPTTPTNVTQFQPQQQQSISTSSTNTYQQAQAPTVSLVQPTGSFNNFTSATEPSHLYRRRLQRLNSDRGTYTDDQPRLDTLMTCPIDHPSSQHNHHGYHNNHASFSADYASTQHFSFDFNHPMNHQHMSGNNHQPFGNMTAPHSADSITDSGLGLNSQYEQQLTPLPANQQQLQPPTTNYYY